MRNFHAVSVIAVLTLAAGAQAQQDDSRRPSRQPAPKGIFGLRGRPTSVPPVVNTPAPDVTPATPTIPTVNRRVGGGANDRVGAGVIYTQTNEAAGNRLAVISRSAAGML